MAWGPAGPSVFSLNCREIDVVRDRSWDPMPLRDVTTSNNIAGANPDWTAFKAGASPPKGETLESGYWKRDETLGAWVWSDLPPPPAPPADIKYAGAYTWNPSSQQWDWKIYGDVKSMESDVSKWGKNVMPVFYKGDKPLMAQFEDPEFIQQQIDAHRVNFGQWLLGIGAGIIGIPTGLLGSKIHENMAWNNRQYALAHGFSEEEYDLKTGDFLKTANAFLFTSLTMITGKGSISPDDDVSHFAASFLTQSALAAVPVAGPVLEAAYVAADIYTSIDKSASFLENVRNIGVQLAMSAAIGYMSRGVVNVVNKALETSAFRNTLRNVVQKIRASPRSRFAMVERWKQAGLRLTDEWVTSLDLRAVGSVSDVLTTPYARGNDSLLVNRDPVVTPGERVGVPSGTSMGERPLGLPAELEMTDFGARRVRAADDLARMEAQREVSRQLAVRSLAQMSTPDRAAFFEESIRRAPSRVLPSGNIAIGDQYQLTRAGQLTVRSPFEVFG